ncbi:heme-degrading monooxygenase IsdG [Alkalihalobacillus alcalophilus ATCC 27647 = CGMCC 1.3604]|uniref:Heme-degrading monooxygenase IsdG n=1 Tax=Alkalihalobacillus alcalophilus ATCC 27647 = CGMCC 1.3604 TaxID=1218173 RepID=A0A094WRD1_ALKAL|nr:heme oxygenase [Alkalihalobacillus alcalophilus]KGA98618.1 heme-degrading monooxygenase IsdG [Alkalihalobacillus alcalophilus ATCC 27647 = CGMCC 1.3604]MED1560461.1 heme oxygenase [Alkalihalobacillus alcalophilus]THG89739.1 heme-degrading monooxygenase IsdG [Alkalihalobacillus alcalophilus ATCC 27647 = CGMCC 1.3604]
MYIVTNRIKIKKGFAEKMAPNFTKPGPLQEMKGFIKVETTIRQNIEEHDELSVNMYWEELENFEAWKSSDAFKQAHARPKSDSNEEKKDSPMLGSEIVIAKVATTIEAKS